MKKSNDYRRSGSKQLVGLIVSVLLVAVVLYACFQKISNSPKGEPNYSNTLESAILDKLQADVVPGDELPLSIRYSNAVYTSISATILSQDDKTGEATVKFKYIDVLALADGYKGNPDDIDEFYECCLQMISSGNGKTITETAKVSYTVLIEDNVKFYVVEEIEDLANILSGGTLSVLKDMLQEGN